MRFRVGDANALAQWISCADENTELELVVDALGWRERRRLRARRKKLPERTMELQSGNAYRRSTAVIADRDPFVVWQQRIVRTHQLADARRVMYRCVEIGVVADVRGQRVLGVTLRHEAAVQSIGQRRALAQNV